MNPSFRGKNQHGRLIMLCTSRQIISAFQGSWRQGVEHSGTKVWKSRVVTGIGVELQDFSTSGARGLRGVSFNCRSCKVARAESSCECVAHL
jgi:hypothetical protein